MDAEQQRSESATSVLEAKTSDDQATSASNTGSVTGPISRILDFQGYKMFRMDTDDHDYELVKTMFLVGTRHIKGEVKFQAICKNTFSCPRGHARLRTFNIFQETMVRKYGSNKMNMKYAWYANSKEELSRILQYGFSQIESPDNGAQYGFGIYLTPEGSSLISLLASTPSEDGLQYVLLCRVILGNQEVVPLGSKQFHPTSEEFHSGIDEHLDPKRYIVWSTYMNTHILPEYIISFKVLPFRQGVQGTPEVERRSTSPWVSIPELISALQRLLPMPSVRRVEEYHRDFREGRITRHDMIRGVREIAGDRLLTEVIHQFHAKRNGQQLRERFTSQDRPGPSNS